MLYRQQQKPRNGYVHAIRKLDIVDMESGGVLAAVEQFNHRYNKTVETLIIRGAGGYGDETHETVIREIAREVHQFAFETTCRFLCCLLSACSREVRTDGMERAVDVGILTLWRKNSLISQTLSGPLRIAFPSAENAKGAVLLSFHHK